MKHSIKIIIAIIICLLISSYAFANTYEELTKGTSGQLVYELQQRLVELGYDTNGIDGNYGGGTESAIMAFQAANELEVTGVADPITQTMLYEGKKPDTTTTNASKSTSIFEKKAGSQFYTTNDKDMAKKGETGVYAYSNYGRNYDQYYIIDLDEGYVYEFCEGNGDTVGEKVKIQSGNLNDYILITYSDGGDTWSNALHFKWKRQPDHLVLEDQYHFEYDFRYTDLDDALKLMATKKITDYSPK